MTNNVDRDLNTMIETHRNGQDITMIYEDFASNYTF